MVYLTFLMATLVSHPRRLHSWGGSTYTEAYATPDGRMMASRGDLQLNMS